MEIESLADGVDLSEPLTRARFEELNNDLFKKTLGPVKRVRCCRWWLCSATALFSRSLLLVQRAPPLLACGVHQGGHKLPCLRSAPRGCSPMAVAHLPAAGHGGRTSHQSPSCITHLAAKASQAAVDLSLPWPHSAQSAPAADPCCRRGKMPACHPVDVSCLCPSRAQGPLPPCRPWCPASRPGLALLVPM